MDGEGFVKRVQQLLERKGFVHMHTNRWVHADDIKNGLEIRSLTNDPPAGSVKYNKGQKGPIAVQHSYSTGAVAVNVFYGKTIVGTKTVNLRQDSINVLREVEGLIELANTMKEQDMSLFKERQEGAK